MDDKLELEHYGVSKSSLVFNVNIGKKPSLTIKATGEIIQNSPKGNIVIEDKKLLAIAYMEFLDSEK